MKRFKLILILVCILVFCGLTAWSDDGRGRGHENDGLSAQDMSAIGLLAASAIGAGIYAVRRRSNSHKQSR